MGERPIVVVSNRGPVRFERDSTGELNPRRGAGGLVSGLTPLMHGSGRVWVAAALSDDDRAAVAMEAGRGAAPGGAVSRRAVEIDGMHTVLAGIDRVDLHAFYEVVCNETLWYVHHDLFDFARRPVFDRGWFTAWDAYERVNAAFADLVADVAPADAAVLIQDYHLYLVASMLADRRPDVRTVHFSHTPFADPDRFEVLPTKVRRQILEGLAAHRACGFHTDKWRNSFLASCAINGVDAPRTFVAPLGPDAADLRGAKSSAGFAQATRRIEEQIGHRRCIARSDRIELSKNLVRGFLAFDVLLESHPEWRGEVVFAASVYPSRLSNPDYVAYSARVEETVATINERWGSEGWTPILLDTSDDFIASIATLARADVVLVNPIRDGLNLVACEAMLVNDRDALLALSPRAGVWDVLGPAAEAVQPFDVVATAEVLDLLLRTPVDERARRSARLRELASSRTPADWLADQLDAAR